MNAPQFDSIVIGSGLAGLTFALHMANHGRVLVVTKASLFESNTSYAQGGIAAAIGDSDSWQLHEEDTLIAGAGLCDPAAVRMLVQRAPHAIEWLASLGTQFDHATSGQSLALGLEGGHSRNRIVHHADKTGWEVERAINRAVRENPNIDVLENAFATDLLMADGRCSGVQIQLADLEPRTISARNVMLATGGAGRLYQHTTNPRIATADGIALAARAGAAISDMEFQQFHPTTLYHEKLPNTLITEAVRGEGGTLRNHQGERFMYQYDERLELAPRDIVARSIHAEILRLSTWCVYLDMTHLKREFIAEHFPTITEKLRSVGIYPYRHWIPIVPAQHYSCGGVNTDLYGQTTIPGLFAAGEVARTGVHGANRLASNSLLEGIVFAEAAANKAKEPSPYRETPATLRPRHTIFEHEAIRIQRALRHGLTEFLGIVRTNAGMEEMSGKLSQLHHQYLSAEPAPYTQYSVETENLLIAAKFVIDGALARRQNVGLHYNVDLN